MLLSLLVVILLCWSWPTLESFRIRPYSHAFFSRRPSSSEGLESIASVERHGCRTRRMIWRDKFLTHKTRVVWQGSSRRYSFNDIDGNGDMASDQRKGPTSDMIENEEDEEEFVEENREESLDESDDDDVATAATLPAMLEELSEPTEEEMNAAMEDLLVPMEMEADSIMEGEESDDNSVVDEQEEGKQGEDEGEEREAEGATKVTMDTLIDESATFGDFGSSLQDAAIRASLAAPNGSDVDKALWEELINHRKQRIELSEKSPKLPGNNMTTLLFRDGKFIRPLPYGPTLTEEQRIHVMQYCIMNDTYARINPNTTSGQQKLRRILFQYPDMLIPTHINSTIKLSHRRKGVRVLDVIELKESIANVVKNRVIQVIEEKIQNGTYLPMETTLPEPDVGYFVKDEEEEDKAELAVALDLIRGKKEVAKFLNRESLAKYREEHRDSGRNITSPAPPPMDIIEAVDSLRKPKDPIVIPRREEDKTEAEKQFEEKDVEFASLTPEEEAMLQEEQRLRTEHALQKFQSELDEFRADAIEFEEFLQNITEIGPNGRKRRTKKPEENLTDEPNSPFPTAQLLTENQWSIEALGSEHALVKESGRTLAERLKYLDERSRNISLEVLTDIPTVAIIVENDVEQIPEVKLPKEKMSRNRKVKMKDAIARLVEPGPPRNRIYIKQQDLDAWRAKAHAPYKEVQKLEKAMSKLKTDRGRANKYEEINKILESKYSLDFSVQMTDVSIDDIRMSLSRLIRNDTLTEEWVEAIEDLANRFETEGPGALTEDDSLTEYVLTRALRNMDREIKFILSRSYHDTNVTDVDVLPAHQRPLRWEYPSVQKDRHPVVLAERLIAEEAQQTGEDPEKIKSIPFSIPYDPYFQRPFAEVYAAVLNTSSNSSMIGVAERLLTHIYEATNQSARISYSMLTFNEEEDGILPPEHADSIQVWVEGHTIFHLVDGVAMKEAWGCIPEHVLFAPKNLNLIVDQVRRCALETELGGRILSPYETSKRVGKQDRMSSMPMTTALNYHEQLPMKFSTVNGASSS